MVLNRYDKNGGYSAENCLWATRKVSTNGRHSPYTFIPKRPKKVRKEPHKRRWMEKKFDLDWLSVTSGDIDFVTACGHLSPDQQLVMVCRMMGYTLEETGAHMGVTRERVRQIEIGVVRVVKLKSVPEEF
jgi:DNA-directed RNA polymerase sigma subunit (sigma70/sigma32)